MKYLKQLQLAGLLVLSYLIIPQNAFAYLDAGTGSYILQLIIGTFFAGLFVIKLFWNKIKLFFKRVFFRQGKM